MKKDTKLNNCIKKVLEIVRSYTLSPEQVRYVFKQVRLLGKYHTINKRKSLPDFMSSAELDFFLSKAMQSDKITSLLANMGVFTGLRIAELNEIKVEDIDFDNYQLKVIKGKGSKDRYVPISSTLLQNIKLFLNGRKSGYLFVKSNNVQYTKRALQKKIQNLIDSCNFTKKLHTHSMRHTYATLLRRNGFSLEQIQVLLGHSNRKTTEIYAHIELGDTKDKYLQLMDRR